MEENSDEDQVLTYTCMLCKKSFLERKEYNRHKRRKNACISPRECELKLTNYEKKFVEMENKLTKLKGKLSSLQDKYEILKENKTKADKRINMYETHVIPLSKPKKGTHVSFQHVNNVTNYNLQMNQYVIQLSPIESPDTSHISDDELRMWMSKNNFEETFPALLDRIYFDENNPINMHWCVATRDKHKGGFLYNQENGIVERIDTDILVRKMFTIGLQCICKRLENIYEARSEHYRSIIGPYMKARSHARQKRLAELRKDKNFCQSSKEEQLKQLLEGEEPTPKLYNEYFSYWTYINKCDGVEPISNREIFLVSSVGLAGGRMARAFWDMHKISRPRVKNNEFNFKLPSNAIKMISLDNQ